MEIKLVHRHMAAGAWDEKVDWCRENLYHGGNYEPRWYMAYPFIVFEDEQEYVAFLLRFD